MLRGHLTGSGSVGPEDHHRPITLAGADRHPQIGQPDRLFLAGAVETQLDHVAVDGRAAGRAQRGEPPPRARRRRSTVRRASAGPRRPPRCPAARCPDRSPWSTARRSLRRRRPDRAGTPARPAHGRSKTGRRLAAGKRGGPGRQGFPGTESARCGRQPTRSGKRRRRLNRRP